MLQQRMSERTWNAVCKYANIRTSTRLNEHRSRRASPLSMQRMHKPTNERTSEPRYCRTNSGRNVATNVGTNEGTSERTKERRNERRNVGTNEGTSARTKERRNVGTNERQNVETNERRNVGTNERNGRTNERTWQTSTIATQSFDVLCFHPHRNCIILVPKRNFIQDARR